MKQNLLAIGGAALGGTLGYFAFFWVASKGYYGLVIPGGLLGIGASLARSRSWPLAVACGVAALLLGLFTEWRFDPSRVDPSLTFFLRHIADRGPITLIMIVLGGVVGFWIPYRGKQP